MSISAQFLAELKQEAIATRNILAAVPMQHKDYSPHKKSMTLGRLATHVAEIPGWWKECLVQDVLDFKQETYVPKTFETTEDLLNHFDDLMLKAEVILNATPDEEYSKPWTMKDGDVVFFTMPKYDVVRTWCLNHLYHHRAQLGVYLRMLDVPLPATYGPSADFNS